MFLSITLPPNDVDVNLEPNKTRVMLAEKEQLLEAMKNLLEKFYGHTTKDNQQLPINSKPQESNLVSNTSDAEKHTSTSDKDCQILQSFDGDSTLHDLQIHNNLIPIASSTLNRTQHELLLSSIDCNPVEKNASCAKSPEQMASFCSLEALNVEKTKTVNQESPNHKNSSSSSVHTHNCTVAPLAQKANTDYNRSVTNGGNSVNKSTFPQNDECSISSFSSDKSVANQFDSGAAVDITSNNNTYREKPKNIIDTKTITEDRDLGKEDMANINQLLELVDDIQKTSYQGTTDEQQLHRVTEKNSSLNFDDVFDDDLEFDKILQGIADKKISSQTLQPQSQKTSEKENSGTKNAHGTDASEKDWSTGKVLKDNQGNVVEVWIFLTEENQPFF